MGVKDEEADARERVRQREMGRIKTKALVER